jgi:hypothetical protein
VTLQAEADPPAYTGPPWILTLNLPGEDKEGMSQSEMICENMLEEEIEMQEDANLVKFTVRGNWVASADKKILRASSTVFKGMFSNTLLENQTNVVTLGDVSKDSAVAFVELLYLGKRNLHPRTCSIDY